MKYFIIPLFLIAVLQSCYYDKEELLYMSADNNCDTLNVTYSGTISPIISGYCLACHGNSTAAIYGNNIKLENYNDLKIQVNNGKFRGAVFHEVGYSAMPKDAGQLSDCKLSQIDIWINAGAPNN